MCGSISCLAHPPRESLVLDFVEKALYPLTTRRADPAPGTVSGRFPGIRETGIKIKRIQRVPNIAGVMYANQLDVSDSGRRTLVPNAIVAVILHSVVAMMTPRPVDMCCCAIEPKTACRIRTRVVAAAARAPMGGGGYFSYAPMITGIGTDA